MNVQTDYIAPREDNKLTTMMIIRMTLGVCVNIKNLVTNLSKLLEIRQAKKIRLIESAAQANSTSTLDLSPSAREISPSAANLIGSGAPPSIEGVRLRGLIRHPGGLGMFMSSTASSTLRPVFDFFEFDGPTFYLVKPSN